jgi:hypothetical protein
MILSGIRKTMSSVAHAAERGWVCGSLILALTAIAGATARGQPLPPLEFGIDRSNMGTEWTLAPPQEPDAPPFLTSEYNDPGNFEARRVAVMDGIARLHVGWFRDGFGKGPLALFVDLVKLVHDRHMKMLAILGPAASDFPPGAFLNEKQSGCRWGTHPLSQIDIPAYRTRIETEFAALRAAGETVDAFEVGNELDVYCNDADNPRAEEWAKHGWTWFLTAAQVQSFVQGYAPFLAASASSIRRFFPKAAIITYGNAMPGSAPLIGALAHVREPDGKIIDYTKLVDGYGSHIYPVSDTTLDMVQGATAALRYEAAQYPHLAEKSIWITEWNPSGSSEWNGRPWYFQYDAHGHVGGDLNKADAQRRYKAMDRAGVIRAFVSDVIENLRSSAANPVNIDHIFFYAYDAVSVSSTCAQAEKDRTPDILAYCNDSVIKPLTGELLPNVAKAVSGI